MEGMTSHLKSPIWDALKGYGFVIFWWLGIQKQQIFHALMFQCMCWPPSCFFSSDFPPSTSSLLSESKPQPSPGRESTFCVCVCEESEQWLLISYVCFQKNIYFFLGGEGWGAGQWLSLFACLQCLLHGVLAKMLLWTMFPQCQHFWP